MSDELTVEASGETVGEAKWAALRELERRHPGLDKSAVRFEVVTEGERGLLGVGYAPARVVAAIPPAAARRSRRRRERGRARCAAPRHAASSTRSGSTRGVGVHEDDESITVTCSGDDVALLIGRHGQTIDAVQYLSTRSRTGRTARSASRCRRRGRLSRAPPHHARVGRRARGGAGARRRECASSSSR